MTFLLLYIEFFKTGLFALGGGLATLPFLYQIADKYTWFTTADISNMLAVSESTPGPIGVNMATYAGFSAGGVTGAVVATLGLVTPSIIVIVLIAKVLDKFSDSFWVKSGFYALRPTVTALIAAAGYSVCAITFVQNGTVKLSALALALVLFTATNLIKKKIHPIVWIALSAAVGIIFKF